MKQPKEKKASKLKISKFELVWYIISGAIALWGFVYVLLGVIANSLTIKASDNYLKMASDTVQRLFGLDFVGWGIILLVLGVLQIVIVLLVKAGKVDKSFEKSERRKARLQRNRNIAENGETPVEQAEENVVDAEVK